MFTATHTQNNIFKLFYRNVVNIISFIIYIIHHISYFRIRNFNCYTRNYIQCYIINICTKYCRKQVLKISKDPLHTKTPTHCA